MTRLAQLAHADYGTAEALDLVEELIDRGCRLERIDAALDDMEERAWREAKPLLRPKADKYRFSLLSRGILLPREPDYKDVA